MDKKLPPNPWATLSSTSFTVLAANCHGDLLCSVGNPMYQTFYFFFFFWQDINLWIFNWYKWTVATESQRIYWVNEENSSTCFSEMLHDIVFKMPDSEIGGLKFIMKFCRGEEKKNCCVPCYKVNFILHTFLDISVVMTWQI
jgi:hypothetical protein